jgi:hypothetical protein
MKHDTGRNVAGPIPRRRDDVDAAKITPLRSKTRLLGCCKPAQHSLPSNGEDRYPEPLVLSHRSVVGDHNTALNPLPSAGIDPLPH